MKKMLICLVQATPNVPLILAMLSLALPLLACAGPSVADECQLQAQPWRLLGWDDPLVQKCIERLDESEKRKVEAARGSEDEKTRTRALRRIQNRVILTSERDGGALTPMTEPGKPWRCAPPQKIVSLGRIAWYGDMEEANRIVRKTGRPLLIASTELPGCGACVGFGLDKLSHPLIVDAALEFVPVAVSGGWPRLHFRDTEGRELAPSAKGKSSVAEILKLMHTALRKAERPIPDWLELVVGEFNPSQRETATFGMGCFWSGESRLGKIDGVLATRCGSLKGEVVELQFDPAVVSYERLLDQARQLKCANKIIARTEQQAELARDRHSDATVHRLDEPIKPAEPGTKHGLKRNGSYARLPLTELQATKLNSYGKDGEKYLAPSQRMLKVELDEFLKQGKDLGQLTPDYSSLGAFHEYARALRKALTDNAK